MTPGIAIDPPVAGAAAGACLGVPGVPRPAAPAPLRRGRGGPRWFGMTDPALATPAAFLTAGDRPMAARSGNAAGKGGALIAPHGPTGAAHDVATGAALTTPPSASQT